MSESIHNDVPTDQSSGDTRLMPGTTVVLTGLEALGKTLDRANLFGVLFGGAPVESLTQPAENGTDDQQLSVTTARGHVCVAVQSGQTEPCETELMWRRIISRAPGLGF